MQEINLTRKKSSFDNILDGINIQGWGGSLIKSAGCTSRVVDGKTIYDFSPSVVNWIRLPYANTPAPLGKNNDISAKFILRALPKGGYACIWSRFRQGDTVASSLIYVYADGRVLYASGNLSWFATGVVKFNEVTTIETKRRGDLVTTYINGVKGLEVTIAGERTAAYDWVFGSYLDFSENIITTTYSHPTDWTLLGILIKAV